MNHPCYYQIHLGERRIIERLYAQGYTAGKIARETFRSRSTIWREIQRNGYPDKEGNWQYNAEIAQRRYARRQESAGSRYLQSYLVKPVKKHVKAYYEYRKILRLARINTKFFRLGEPYDRYRIYNPSRWNQWEEKHWRKRYNYFRSRLHSWEEMGRRIIWPAKYYNFSKRLTAWTSARSERFQSQQRYTLRGLQNSFSLVRDRERKSWIKDIHFFPASEITLPGKRIVRPKTKAQTKKINPIPQATVSMDWNGRGASDAQESHQILKILTVFDQESPRLLLKSA